MRYILEDLTGLSETGNLRLTVCRKLHIPESELGSTCQLSVHALGSI